MLCELCYNKENYKKKCNDWWLGDRTHYQTAAQKGKLWRPKGTDWVLKRGMLLPLRVQNNQITVLIQTWSNAPVNNFRNHLQNSEKNNQISFIAGSFFYVLIMHSFLLFQRNFFIVEFIWNSSEWCIININQWYLLTFWYPVSSVTFEKPVEYIWEGYK